MVAGAGAAPDAAPVGTNRLAWFGGDVATSTEILAREAMRVSVEHAGPAVVEGSVDTTVVPPGWVVALDSAGSLLLRRDA
jgi:N-methylhydantoinase A/oxoprolinase/acetone carboxylase beta subunit